MLDMKEESVARQCKLLEPNREEMKEIQTKVDKVWPLSCLAMDKASELEGEGEIPYKINCVMSYFLVAFKERNQSN